MRTNNQVIGNIGLYWACFKLSCMGWNVMPTARNARGIDMIAYSQDGSDKLGFQVKALSKRNQVPLGTSIDSLMGDYWIIVTDARSNPKAFIMKPAEIKRRAHRGEKDGRVSYWLQPSSYDTDEFREKWDRIGYGDQKRPFVN
jgi:hypothetical protein